MEKQKPLKIAVIQKHYLESTPMGNGLPYCGLHGWHKGDVVYCQEDVERLIKCGAPVKVYVEDVN